MSLVPLDKEIAIKKISIDCMDALSQAIKGNCLYFASDDSNVSVDFGLVRPEKMSYEEDSRYEIIHNLIEKAAGWSKFPKRQTAIITSTSSVPMDRKNKVFIVLPKNGTKLGVCSDDDYYSSFNKLETLFDVQDAYDFEEELKELLQCVHKFVHDKEMEEFEQADIEQCCKMFDNIMKALKGSYDFKQFYETTTNKKLTKWQKNTPLYQKIIQGLDPELNGFEVKSIRDLKKQKNKEVWFSSECYIITKELFAELIDSGKLAHITEDV